MPTPLPGSVVRLIWRWPSPVFVQAERLASAPKGEVLLWHKVTPSQAAPGDSQVLPLSLGARRGPVTIFV